MKLTIEELKEVSVAECADTSIINDRVFVRQAAIAIRGGDVCISPDQAVGRAVELLSAIKQHEQEAQ